MKARLESGDAGWVGLILYVVLFDVWQWHRGRPTLSICFGRWCQQRLGKVGLAVAWGSLSCHLFVGRPRWWHMPERKVSDAVGS